MKKIVLAVLALAGAFVGKRLLDKSTAERKLWAEATDPVQPS